VQLATLQQLARYWMTEYDWRKAEAKLNALPQFTTEIDGVDIHFIHVKSPHENALPLIMTHGWPGSVMEMIDSVGPLADPTAHGGSAEDAFHLVLPSLPGYGFSGEPGELGWDLGRTAQAPPLRAVQTWCSSRVSHLPEDPETPTLRGAGRSYERVCPGITADG
jgi:pimeloyl-ACP methyl ester carboxylesterase